MRLLRDPLPLCNLPQMNSVNSTDHTGGVVELDFDKSISDGVNIYAKRDGFQADFVFLACRADLSRRSWRKAEVRRRWALH